VSRVFRIVVVVLFVAYALAGVVAAASVFWEPAGTIGITTDYGGNVRAIDPGSPADAAGLLAGDRIDLATIPFEERRYVAGVGATIPIGQAVHLGFVRNGAARNVVLTAVPYRMTTSDRTSLLLECVASLIFTVVGAALIVLRPTEATWGFGLYCLLVLPTAAYPFRLPSAATAFALISFYDIVQNVGNIGLLLFALDFPQPIAAPWRLWIRRALPLIFVVLAAMTWYPDIRNLIYGRPAEIENRTLQLAFGVVSALAIFIQWDTYRRTPLGERERLRWVLAGFGVGLTASYVGNLLEFSSLVPINPPIWLINVLTSLNVLLPLAVAHAVVRHRVLDINFVISRAIVYASLTATLAGVFAVSDWLIGRMLEDFRLSLLTDAATSIGIAFAFDALHKRVESWVDGIFFRSRRQAELRMQQLARVLPQARAEKVVDDALAIEASDALALTSAAIFRLAGEAGFTRVSSAGWLDAQCKSLDDGDLLVLALRAGTPSVRLAQLPWRRTDVPHGAGAPIVGVAVRARGELFGVALYGAHPSGGDIDPSELALLESLAHAAGVAYDELDAARLREENAAQSSQIGELTARLDELRRNARLLTGEASS
jgi:hypothetical protein